MKCFKICCLLTLLLSLSLSLQGCFFAPAIDSFKKLGVSATDRQALLAQQIKRFNDALHWGTNDQILALVSPMSREQIANDLEDEGEDMKVVDTRVADTSFDESAYKATVKIALRYYKVPYYVVKTRKEKQIWDFSLSDGWLLESREFEG